MLFFQRICAFSLLALAACTSATSSNGDKPASKDPPAVGQTAADFSADVTACGTQPRPRGTFAPASAVPGALDVEAAVTDGKLSLEFVEARRSFTDPVDGLNHELDDIRVDFTLPAGKTLVAGAYDALDVLSIGDRNLCTKDGWGGVTGIDGIGDDSKPWKLTITSVTDALVEGSFDVPDASGKTTTVTFSAPIGQGVERDFAAACCPVGTKF